jgi:hypothetical protein
MAIYANTVYFQNPPYLFTLEPKLSRFTRNLTSVIFTNNKRVGLKWALSLANPISCLGSVPRDLFKSFRAGGIL